jgi:hypothetical protein
MNFAASYHIMAPAPYSFLSEFSQQKCPCTIKTTHWIICTSVIIKQSLRIQSRGRFRIHAYHGYTHIIKNVMSFLCMCIGPGVMYTFIFYSQTPLAVLLRNRACTCAKHYALTHLQYTVSGTYIQRHKYRQALRVYISPPSITATQWICSAHDIM